MGSSMHFGLPLSRTDWIQVRRLGEGHLRWPGNWWVSNLRTSQRRALLAQNGTEKADKGQSCFLGAGHNGRVSEFCKGHRRNVGRRLAWINLDWQLVGGFLGGKGWNCLKWNILYSGFITNGKGLQQGQGHIFLSCILHPCLRFWQLVERKGQVSLGVALVLLWGDSVVDLTPAVAQDKASAWFLLGWPGLHH